jgi:hypothetical protein
MAGDDRDHVPELAHPAYGVVVDVPDRVPEQVAAGRPHQHRLLTDPGRRFRRHAVQVGLDLLDHHLGPVGGQLVERGPVLTVGGHPLAFVGADRAHLDPLGVLDRTGRTDPETHRVLPSL